ncbi:MAG TPA: efflux RND transporter periplasmic adaptor subunit [Candidatus Sulfopaludibacter sp.]|nr:efflux RND transporter periplasmic adaptor subunit [Candidatus Sulfopaludibacter sp.]
MNRFTIFALIATSLFAAACARNEAATTSSAAVAKKVVVTVSPATTRTVPASFEVTGTFNPDETSDIAPLVAGRVIATPADVGDFVKQGQVICELDHRDAQLRLDQARAQLEEATAALRQTQSRIGWDGKAQFDPNNLPEVVAAHANYTSAQAQAKMAAADAKRFESLVATGDVSRSAYEKARTAQETAEAQAHAASQQYEAALNGARMSWGAVETSQASLAGVRAQLAQAEKALQDTTIRAPYDGYITARPVAAGMYVALNNKIATIVRIGILKLQLQTPEQRAAQVKLGMSVLARVAAYPGRDFAGKVTALNPSVDPGSRIFILEARFDNPGAELRPGMFATARILLPGGEKAVFVPQSAVIRDKTTDSFQVFTIENGTAHLRVVLTGDTADGLVRIQSGLAGGESVATSHEGDLFDGATVETRS